MPIDELGNGIIRGVLRFIGHFIIDVIIEIILHKTGWLFLRIVTFGRYPPHDPKEYNEGFAIAVGIFVWVVIGAVAWGLLK